MSIGFELRPPTEQQSRGYFGYNRWAGSNQIVVLYPQATEASGNPKACWDFWGYSGDGWRTREGVQMRAVASMVERLLER